MNLAEKVTLIQRGDVDTSLMHLGLKGMVFAQVFDSLDVVSAATGTLIDIPAGELGVSIPRDYPGSSLCQKKQTDNIGNSRVCTPQ